MKKFTEANRMALRLIAAGKLCDPGNHKKLCRDGYIETKRDHRRSGGYERTIITPKGQRELNR